MAAGHGERKPVRALTPGPPSAVPGPAFVGRDHELGQLEAELARSRPGAARCVLLSGEAGVGKTRLARELLARHPRQVLSLSARAYPLGSTTAFGLWAEALERHLQQLTPGEVAEVCGGYLDDLAVLLHSVAAADAPRTGNRLACACSRDWPGSSATWWTSVPWWCSWTTSTWLTPRRGRPSSISCAISTTGPSWSC